MTAAQKRDYSFAIRTLLVATSATLARSTAGAIYSLASACRYGPAAPAAAQAGAAAQAQ